MKTNYQNEFPLELKTTSVLSNNFIRFIAFLLDIILIVTLTITLLGVFIIPNFYLNEFQEFQNLLKDLNLKVISGEINKLSMQYIDISISSKKLVQFIQIFVFMMVWMYFFISAILMKGNSIGKKIFSLRIFSEDTNSYPSLGINFLRSLVKTLTLLFFFPILSINYLFCFFTKKKQALHDVLCKTIVINY